MNRNRIALTIASYILLFILWLIFRASPEHVWSSWLFLALFIPAFLFLALFLLNFVSEDSFGTGILLTVLGIGFYLVALNGEVEFLNTIFLESGWFTAIKVFSYIIDGVIGFLLLYAGIRYAMTRL